MAQKKQCFQEAAMIDKKAEKNRSKTFVKSAKRRSLRHFRREQTRGTYQNNGNARFIRVSMAFDKVSS